MFDPLTIIMVGAVFFIAGTVKGVIGLGLPTVSLALLTVIIDLPSAMSLLLVPSFATNLWQALVGGYFFSTVRRIWIFLAMAVATVWLGSAALTRIDFFMLSGLLGILLIIYAIVSLAGFHVKINKRYEFWIGPLAGAVNGIFTGMTGSFTIPGVLYLQALGFSRNQLIQAMGILFTLSTLALASALNNNNIITSGLGKMSVIALLPALVGMLFGQRIRRVLSEELFRHLFFIFISALGVYLVANACTNLI